MTYNPLSIKSAATTVPSANAAPTKPAYDSLECHPAPSPEPAPCPMPEPSPRPMSEPSKVPASGHDWEEGGQPTMSIEDTDKAGAPTGTDKPDHIDAYLNHDGINHDTMSGGWGDDTLAANCRFEKIIEKGGQGVDAVMPWDTGFRLPVEDENLVVSTKPEAKVWDNPADDLITAGAGKDTFTFLKGNGHDPIKGFEVGQDHIHPDAPVPVDQVSGHVVPCNPVPDLPGDHSICLLGVTNAPEMGHLFT
jgi:hypothetical protein